MKKSLVFAVLVVSLLFLVKPVGAKNDRSIGIPQNAKEVGPGVFSLGEALDIDGRPVQGFMIVKRENARGGAAVNGGPKGNQCYSYLASGAKWKTSENYMVDPSNVDGVGAGDVISIIASGIGKWETGANAEIMGNKVDWTGNGADTTSPDNKNEVLFGDITDPGVIAVTTVWGVFGGSPSSRYLAEWDQVYDDVSFDWSVAPGGEPNKMDVENIAVHEIGHALGMGHPSDTCSNETMYRYASNGETKKRDLNPGDILGIDKLY